MDSAQVSVFKEADHVSFGSFLKSENGLGLESEVSLHFLSDLADKSLERQFSDEKLCRLLEFSDFSKGDSTRSESVRLLDSTLRGDCCSLSSSLVGELFAGSLSAGVLAGSLLGAGHFLLFLFYLLAELASGLLKVSEEDFGALLSERF